MRARERFFCAAPGGWDRQVQERRGIAAQHSVQIITRIHNRFLNLRFPLEGEAGKKVDGCRPNRDLYRQDGTRRPRRIDARPWTSRGRNQIYQIEIAGNHFHWQKSRVQTPAHRPKSAAAPVARVRARRQTAAARRPRRGRVTARSERVGLNVAGLASKCRVPHRVRLAAAAAAVEIAREQTRARARQGAGKRYMREQPRARPDACISKRLSGLIHRL